MRNITLTEAALQICRQQPLSAHRPSGNRGGQRYLRRIESLGLGTGGRLRFRRAEKMEKMTATRANHKGREGKGMTGRWTSEGNGRRTRGGRKGGSRGSSEVVRGWIEAMRASSPGKGTRAPSSPCQRSPTSRRRILPSAIRNFDQMIGLASNKKIVVFLDYDGTLSPIIENPEEAFMTNEMREIVKEVATVFPTAIISGRSREKIREFVKLPELYYAGSHGMDIMGPESKTFGQVFFQAGNEYIFPINEVFKLLEDKVKDIDGAKVEHNKFCVTVHFRCVKEKDWIALAKRVHEIVRSYPGLYLTEGRKILEIRPLITWNKGKALDYLLKEIGLKDQNNIFPIYIGDDRSDEDAFKAVNRRNHGLSILVSNTAKETNAICGVSDTNEVAELLTRLVTWKRQQQSSKFP